MNKTNLRKFQLISLCCINNKTIKQWKCIVRIHCNMKFLSSDGKHEISVFGWQKCIFHLFYLSASTWDGIISRDVWYHHQLIPSKVYVKVESQLSSRFAVTPCVISTIAKLRYRFWKEPNRTTRISTVAKWEIWFRENHGDFTGSSLRFD